MDILPDPPATTAREKTFEVVLRGGKPWGFEVSGGLDEGQPLTLSHITEDGKAWDCGLIKGDVIIRVNDIACLSSNEARQLINSAFRTLTLKLWRSSNTPNRLSSRTASYRKRVDDARTRDIKPDVQDDSVVYDQSKSSQGLKMKPRTRRGESFNVKKSSSRNRSDQEQQWQTTSTDSGQRFYENQQPTYKNPLSASIRKLAPAKSSPSLNKIEIQVPPETQGKSLSAAKSSPNLNNENESEGYGHVNRKNAEYYNNNYERYSLDGPTGINPSWNLGSGDFKRSYVDQPAARMHDITDSYEKEGKSSKKITRRSLPPYMLQKYQADYENISDYGTTPLRSEKISEIDDLDSDEDVSNIHILQTTQLESLVSPQSPPIPPVRDPSSLKYIKINQSHEKYPSWPVTKSNGGVEPSQPINTRAQSWTDTNTNTNKDFPVNKPRLAYTPGLRPLPERNSPNAERREDGKSRAGSDPGLKSEFVYDKYGRVQQRDYNKVDQNQIKKFYEQKPGYPPPKLDSDGHNLGDEKYNVPSPPERDVPSLEERERLDENTVINKTVTRPTSFTPQSREPTRNKLNYSVQNTVSPMTSPMDIKGGQLPLRDSKPDKLMVDSCTSPQHSPKDSKTDLTSRHRIVEPSPSSQLKSTTKAYIVKQTPYYNTSTQTDQSPPSNSNMLITIPKPMPRKTVSDNAVQTSPTSTEKNVFTDQISPNTVRPDKRDYNQKEKRSNYSDINSLSSRRESDNHTSAKSTGNYADFSALQANYADVSNLKSIHERYSSDIAEDDNSSNNIPHYSEYTASQAPILRELSREFYKGRMPGNYDKRVISPNESSRSSDSMQPGMKEAESYSSVIIHSSESAAPFGRDDFGSRSSLSDSRQDIYSVVSESASSRSSIAKGRRSLDPSMLSHRQRPLNETRYNSSSLVNHSRTVSSPTSDYRRPRRSSEASTPSQPKSSPDSRSSGSTYYSSDTSQSRLHDISHDRHESVPDSVFGETRSPLPTETELKSPKSDSKDKNLNMNLGRKPSMKKAYGIYDETERVLRGAAATLKAVNEAQNLRRVGENYAPLPRLSRGSSESKILDQIQEENDVFIDPESQRSRSSSGREDGSKTSDKTKRELFSGEFETQRSSGMKRSSSELIHKYVPNSIVDQPEKTRESTPNLATHTDPSSPLSRSNLTLDIQKRNSESDLKKIQHQAVLNFMELKTGKRMSSSGSQEATTPNGATPTGPTPTGDPTDLGSPTQSVQELITKTSENLANRTQRTDSFRRSGSSSSSKNSQDYMEMNRSRKETEWSKMRSQGPLSYGSNRSSLCSENTYEDINVFSPNTPRSSTTEKPKDDMEVPLPDSSFDRPRESSTSGMDCNLISSPTYQNLFSSRRRPPPPPPLLSPEEKPPALPPRNYRKPLNDPPTNKSPVGVEEAVDQTKMDFKSLMNQWEGSPREDSYAADLRRQARRFSEQQPNSTNMSILHSKTKINFSQSYKREPVLVHQATSPQNTNSSFEEKNAVTSPVLEQPMVIEEGNKENKAPSTPVKQPMSDEEVKTPPRVDRSISELSLPSPPINYGTLESNHSELPPPPPEVLEEAEQDDQFADDSYGAYRNKSMRVPGSYKRSVSDANVHSHLENSDTRVEDMGKEKKKLGQSSWNSESSLSGAVSQPKRPRDVPSDNIGNVPSFKVESTSRSVIKGTTEPLAPPSRFTNVIPNSSLSYSAQNKPSLSNVTSAPRLGPRALNTSGEKDAARNRVQMIEKKGPITKSQTEADRSVAEWLNKNETIPNSPVNSGLQPKNINENLNVQRSKTFNSPHSQTEAKTVMNSGKHYSPQDEIKKRSAFNSPTPYGTRPYQSSYAPVNISSSPQHPIPSLSNSNRPKDGNKPVPQERTSMNSKPTETSSSNADRQTWNSPTDKSPAAKSARYSGEFIRDRKSDHFRPNNPQNNDKTLKSKGGYSNDINQRDVKGTNSPVNSNNQSFVISSNSAKQLSPSHNSSVSSPTTKTSSPSVQSSDSLIEKSISSSSLPPGTICHGRQRSQEELDCDQKAKELAKELNEQDKKLSDVLVQDSNTKRMQYMDGLFIEPVKPRKLSSDESEKKMSREDSSPSGKNQVNNDHSNNLPASYYTSPPKALMEIQLRNNNDLTTDLTKDIVNDNSSLIKQKEELMEKLHKKLDILRKEKSALEEEIGENDLLGEKMTEIVESQCELKSEQDKYKLFIQDHEKIVRLLLNLSGQLARAENAVQSLNNSTSPKIKKMTLDKRERLQEKHEEAKVLKENIDKRSQQVLLLLESRLTEAELEDYKYYVTMKSKLTIDFQEMEDRIKLGEEQIQELKKSIPESKC